MDNSKFIKELDTLGIHLSDIQQEQFDRYYELLIEWNRVMNLTGITAYEEVNLKHFTDSLTIVRINDMKNVSTLIDIGTGAGFPGIPIKIAFPHIKVVLLDSLNKRIKFLNEVVEKLNLDNVETLQGRAEDYAKKAEYREQFDMCVSRAVANLSTLGEYCIPFVKNGGCFVSYKSADSDEEIYQSEKAISILGGKISKIDKFMLPGSDMGRALVVIEKDKNTPQKYPRKAGVPSKEPLYLYKFNNTKKTVLLSGSDRKKKILHLLRSIFFFDACFYFTVFLICAMMLFL